VEVLQPASRGVQWNIYEGTYIQPNKFPKRGKTALKGYVMNTKPGTTDCLTLHSQRLQFCLRRRENCRPRQNLLVYVRLPETRLAIAVSNLTDRTQLRPMSDKFTSIVNRPSFSVTQLLENDNCLFQSWPSLYFQPTSPHPSSCAVSCYVTVEDPGLIALGTYAHHTDAASYAGGSVSSW
jgi:hypothetical protein